MLIDMDKSANVTEGVRRMAPEPGAYRAKDNFRQPVMVEVLVEPGSDLVSVMRAVGGSIRVIMPVSDEALHPVLERLGFAPVHGAPLNELREYERAAAALRVISAGLNTDLSEFIGRPLADYGGQTPEALTLKHGVRALEALANDLSYPTPA